MNQKKQLLLGAAAVLFAVATGTAQAKDFNNLLRGDYAFSGQGTCLNSPGGFDGNLIPISFPSITTFSVQGVRTFNGDGTGKVVARVVSIRHPSGSNNLGGANSNDNNSDFTYEVGADQRTVVLITVTSSGTFLTGHRAYQTFSVTNFPIFAGRISQDHRTLTIAHGEPGVETITFSNGDVTRRICHRSRILLEQKD